MALREVLGRVSRGELEAKTAQQQRLVRRVAVALYAFDVGTIVSDRGEEGALTLSEELASAGPCSGSG